MKPSLFVLALLGCLAFAPSKAQAQYGVVYSVGYPAPAVHVVPRVSYSVRYAAPAPVVHYRPAYAVARPVVAPPVYRAAYPVYRPAYRPVIAPVRPWPIRRPRVVVPAVYY